MKRLSLTIVSLVLVAGACGEGDSSEPAATTTTEPATTSIATTTTLLATTTTPSTTSSTSTTSTTTTTLPVAEAVLPEASPRLAEAIESALGSECVTRERATEVFLSLVDGDLGVDSMVALTPFGDAGGKLVSTGILFTGAYPLVTTDDPDLALAHAQLYMNHVRSYAALSSWIISPTEFLIYQGSLVDIRGEDFRSELEVLATWGLPPDSNTMADYAQELHLQWEAEEYITPLPWDSMLRPPVVELVVDETTRLEGWEIAEGRIEDLASVAHGITETAAPQLEEMAGDLKVLRGVFCVLLATEQQIAETKMSDHVDDPAWLQEHVNIFFREVAAQEALLALEYFDVIVSHLEQSDVDWLRSPQVDLSQDMTDSSTSTTEYVYLWLDAAAATLAGCAELINVADA